MRRIITPLLISTGTVAVLFLLIGLPWLMDMEPHRLRIMRVLEDFTGRSVTLSDVTLSMASGLSIHVDNLEIGAVDPTEPPILYVERVSLGIKPSFLFHPSDPKSLKISSITLSRPQINLVKRRSRTLSSITITNDHTMFRTLGHGLAALLVNRLSIKNGLLTIIDWNHPHGQTLIVDHFQLQIHNIAPNHPSPFSATARFQDIPFTLNGQIGPLPKTMDLFTMPILLSLEAKSIHPTHFSEIFSGWSHKPETSRIYLSMLINGTLKKGLQSNFRVELDQLSLNRDGVRLFGPLDVTIRQKSVFTISSGTPELFFDESFIYVDHVPVLEMHGNFQQIGTMPLNVWGTTIQAIDISALALSQAESSVHFDGAVEGSFRMTGHLVSGFDLVAELDLTQTAFMVSPHIQKDEGVELALRASIFFSDKEIHLNELLFKRKGAHNSQLQISGEFWPTQQLEISTDWDLAFLSLYAPAATPWDLKGILKADLNLSDEKLSGDIKIPDMRVGTIPFTNFSTYLHANDKILQLQTFFADIRESDLSGTLQIGQGEEPFFHTTFMLTGNSLETLLDLEKEKAIRLDGTFTAQAVLQGLLERSMTPPQQISGQINLQIEPGHIMGIDGQAGGSQHDKKIDFNQLTSHLTVINQQVRFESIHLKSDHNTFTGTGMRTKKGILVFDLLNRPNKQDDLATSLHINGTTLRLWTKSAASEP